MKTVAIDRASRSPHTGSWSSVLSPGSMLHTGRAQPHLKWVEEDSVERRKECTRAENDVPSPRDVAVITLDKLDVGILYRLSVSRSKNGQDRTHRGSLVARSNGTSHVVPVEQHDGGDSGRQKSEPNPVRYGEEWRQLDGPESCKPVKIES